METVYHTPVLLHESVDRMITAPNGKYLDLTFGGGGHTREILSKLQAKGHLYAFDQDLDTLNNAPEDKRFTFVRSNFRFLKNFMHYYDIESVDGILADLGVSSHHFDEAERGFSFRFANSSLDMRMNQKSDKTAATILNTYSEEQLADMFYFYGELRQARQIASCVVKARTDKKYKTVNDLLDTLKTFTTNRKENKILAQAFQALRIEVNDEMQSLKEMLQQSLEILKPGGRISVITYHSLEDRLVKNFFKSGNFEGEVEKDFFGNINTPFTLVNNKVIVPDNSELERNPRSRSAKLRVAEKKQK